MDRGRRRKLIRSTRVLFMRQRREVMAFTDTFTAGIRQEKSTSTILIRRDIPEKTAIPGTGEEVWWCNGDLFVKPIPQVLEAVGREEPLQMQALTGEWKLEKDQAEVDTPYDFSALLLNPVGETSRLSFDVEVAGDNPSIGIAVHVGETFTVGYYLLIDFGRRRIEFKSGVRMTERGGQMFPYEVELERPLPMSTGKSFHVDVIADGTILEAYVDGKIALGTRMYDQTGGCFGLYASDGKAVFWDIKVFHA